MILFWLIFSLPIGGAVAWISGRWHVHLPRLVSLATLALHLAFLLALWTRLLPLAEVQTGSPWLEEFDVAWIPQFGIRLHLGLDGLSLLLIVLANFLGVMAVLASWKEIQSRIGFFHFNLLAILAALAAIFMALDLFLFYLSWEVMLVPLYFLIAIWGHQRRLYAAMKFFLFAQASGLLMLVAILGLYFAHGQASGVYSFDYLVQLDLAKSHPLDPTLAFWLMMGFCAAFAVKLPMLPLHTWLPDAHAEAPTAGSVDLSGLVLKIGGYGLLRFLVPLFPVEASHIAPYAMALGVAGILYGALVALGQTDLKRLIAYTSISHMGFVLLGVFSWNQLALQGAVMIMIAHGVSTGALFILVGDLQHRTGTRELDRMGGLWSTMPRLGGAAMVFALASLGLPAFGNFVGEFLVLLGAFRANPPIAAAATLGFIVSTIYSLWMMQRVFFGPNQAGWKPPDSSPRETGILATMIAVILWLGIFPQTVLETSRGAVSALEHYAERSAIPTAAATFSTPADEAAAGGARHRAVQYTSALPNAALADPPRAANPSPRHNGGTP
jgi:NADH-quinone oxidoreductase subunit M